MSGGDWVRRPGSGIWGRKPRSRRSEWESSSPTEKTCARAITRYTFASRGSWTKSEYATLEHWYSTARVSKRPTGESAACLRARYCTNLPDFPDEITFWLRELFELAP